MKIHKLSRILIITISLLACTAGNTWHGGGYSRGGGYYNGGGGYRSYGNNPFLPAAIVGGVVAAAVGDSYYAHRHYAPAPGYYAAPGVYYYAPGY